MNIISDISDIPLRVRFSFSINKEQHQTFEEFCKDQREKPKNLVLIKAKDRPFPIRYDDVLVRMKGVPRYYPDNDDKTNLSKTENENEEPFSIIKPDIKIVGKIEPVELDLLKQKEIQVKLSKEQLKEQINAEKKREQEERKQANAAKKKEKNELAKQMKEQAKAAKKMEKKQEKLAKKLKFEQEKAARILEKEQTKAAKRTDKELEIQNSDKILTSKSKPLTKSQKSKINKKVHVQEKAKSGKKPTTFQSFIEKFKNERQIELEYPLKVAYIKPDDLKYRYDDVLVKMKHIHRFYPKDFDKEKQPISGVKLDNTRSVLNPEIKVVDKIELDTLNEKTRPDKK